MLKKFLLLLIALLAVTSAEANDACQADIDGNGVVDFADLLLFTEHYGETCAKTVDADSLAAMTTLRDSISALQTTLASETERANENKRLLTASNEAFNSLSQTRCPEPEPPAQAEPPVVIEPQPPLAPPPTPSLSLPVVTTLRDSISALQTALASETERANENKRLLTASNVAFNSLVPSLRDSISTLQAALGAARFAVTTLQTALASETKRANENKRLLTASNDAFNSLAQTRCPEPEPPAPEPPVVIEPDPAPQPPAQPEPEPWPVPQEPTASLSFEVTVGGSARYVDIKVFLNGLSKPLVSALVRPRVKMPWYQCDLTAPPGGSGDKALTNTNGAVIRLSPTEPFDKQHVGTMRCWKEGGGITRPLGLDIAVNYYYTLGYSGDWNQVRDRID